ncbi:hypothetical protein GCM10022222_09260 [Amycolatopsis ultiminotia]|uniref:Enterochelin esterase N-terminal domain-containing protein n=1 Tax=Amycolatopsis ultiminotia TaxID=543629 RepID=A0ABP6V5E6_9PSEU
MIRSASISRFAAQHRIEPAAALGRLRAELETARGPLVEPIDGSDRVLVTFVYLEPATAVRISCELWPYELDTPGLGPVMSRIEGTDVRYASVEADPRVRVPYQFQIDPPSFGASLEDAHALISDRERLESFMGALFESGRADPFNPVRHYPYTALLGGDPDGTAGEDRWESILTLPDAEPPSSLDGEPVQGRLERHVLAGGAFPGDREVVVYLPPGYDSGTEYPLAVLLDGELWRKSGRVDEVIDAAIVDGTLPPLIVAFWSNLTSASRMSEMNVNPALPVALADELLPWLRSRYRVQSDPAQIVVGGQSYGGLASAFTALQRPEVFGAALLISPSLWFTPPGEDEHPAVSPGGWMARQYAERGPAPIRLYVSVGTLECAPIPKPGMNGQSMLDLARNFRDAVAAAGYSVAGYREEPGGHNHITVRRVVVPGLAALLRAPAALTAQETV